MLYSRTMEATEVPTVALNVDLYTSGVQEEQFRRRLATLLVAALRERGMEQRYLASQVGVTPTTVSRWLTGRFSPKGYELHRIAEALGLDADLILFPPPTQLEAVRTQRRGPIPEDEAAIAEAEAARKRESAGERLHELKPPAASSK